MKDCLICQKHINKTDIVYQDDFVSVSHMTRRMDEADNYLGYYMVESMRHFKGMYDAADDEMAAIGKMLKALSKAMMDVLDAAHVYAFIMGDGIPHFHVHVVARYKDAPREYWGPKVDDWPDAPRGTIDDVRTMNEKIRQKLLKIYNN